MSDLAVNPHAEPLHALLDHAARQEPDKAAIVSDERTVTYRELAEESRRAAAWLHEAGVGRGDRVVLLLPNRIETVSALFAVSRLGAIFVILSTGMRPYQLRHVLADAEPALLLTGEDQELPEDIEQGVRVVPLGDYRQGVRAARAEPPVFPGITIDPVCLIYTSGSTSVPKGVVSTHANMRFAAAAIGQRLGIADTDVVGVFLPMSFDYGLYQVFLSMQALATLALGGPEHVGPGLLSKLSEWQVTGLPLVPSIATAISRLVRRTPEQDLPKLRFVTNTGARLGPQAIDELRTIFPAAEVFPMFGLTECKRVSILDPADYPSRPESVGPPLPDTECFIVGDDGRVLPPGEPGELVVRGPHVMAGYWRAPELTDRRFRPWGDGTERVLFSGDRCSMDADGYLYFHGRDDDIYKSRGYRVSALEVEGAAAGLDGVEDAALLPPADGGPARLVVTGELTPPQVLAGLRDRLEDYKVPDEVTHIATMPRNVNGKTDKQRLRESEPGEGRTGGPDRSAEIRQGVDR
jgi:acyl-CoA synthetase (AMP-forming)/AMP-acid ligase II